MVYAVALNLHIKQPFRGQRRFHCFRRRTPKNQVYVASHDIAQRLRKQAVLHECILAKLSSLSSKILSLYGAKTYVNLR